MRQLLSFFKFFALLAFFLGSFNAFHVSAETTLASSLQKKETKFLPADKAFKLHTEIYSNRVVLTWTIEPNYYMYKDRFRFKLLQNNKDIKLGEPVFSKNGKTKHDPNFDEIMEVFYKNISITIPITVSNVNFEMAEIQIRSQGCAEAGLCYPPQIRTLEYSPEKWMDEVATQAESVQQVTQTPVKSTQADESLSLGNVGDIQKIFDSTNVVVVLLLAFVLGVGISFTPCVYPMIPIMSSLIAGQDDNLSVRKGFIYSMAYVQGVSIMYAMLGLIVALIGQNVQAFFQHPAFIITGAVILVAFAISMFGFFELQLPSFLTNKMNDISNNQNKGSLFGLALMGFFSALVVSPCLSAPLAAVLGYVATTGNALLGVLILYLFGLGSGSILILVGMGFGGALPSNGMWMEAVKKVFGFMMLGVAIYLLGRIIDPSYMMLIWAVFIIYSGIYLGAFKTVEQGWPLFFKSAGIIAFIYGAALLVGALAGSTSMGQPLSGLVGSGSTTATQSVKKDYFKTVYTVTELKQEIADANRKGKRVMFDFYADWCVSCITMNKNVFSQSDVQAQLSDFEWIKVDVTDNTADDVEFMKEFDVFGPPSILFFGLDGQELRSVRIVGEMGKQEFLDYVETKVKLEK